MRYNYLAFQSLFLHGSVSKKYNANSRRVLKHKILKKRKDLTDDVLLINEVLEELQAL